MDPGQHHPIPSAIDLATGLPLPSEVYGGQPIDARYDEVEPKTAGAKGLSFLLGVGINALILLLLAWWGLTTLKPEEVELVLEAGTTETQTTVDRKQFQQKQQTKPTPSSGSKSPPMITSVVTDPTATFVVESKIETDAFGIGDGWGKGAGFGSGGGGGGSVGFFGSRSTAQRVVLITDVSMSLSPEKFAMIKRELSKTLDKLSPSIQYQVIFFSGPAWFAEDDHAPRNTVSQGGKKFKWVRGKDNYNFTLADGSGSYTAKWLQASPAQIKKTLKRIEEVQRSGGTDWRNPLTFALEMNPKPDVVYFLTDGAVRDGESAVELILKLNKRKGTPAKINTIAMMQPKAEALLAELAHETKGEFTIVKQDGSVERPKRRK